MKSKLKFLTGFIAVTFLIISIIGVEAKNILVITGYNGNGTNHISLASAQPSSNQQKFFRAIERGSLVSSSLPPTSTLYSLPDLASSTIMVSQPLSASPMSVQQIKETGTNAKAATTTFALTTDNNDYPILNSNNKMISFTQNINNNTNDSQSANSSDTMTSSPSPSQSLTTNSSSPSLPGTAYFTVWKDPNENAFTILLPLGWKATGGTLRTISGTNDADFWFNATDPTNKEVIFGANALAYYVLPTPLLGPDGSLYPGSGSPIPIIYNYRNASDYIRQFVVPFLQRTMAPDIQIVRITDYPIPNSSLSSIVITQASGATAILSFTMKDKEQYKIGVNIVTLGWATGWDAIALAVSAPQNDFDKVTQLARMIIPTFTEKPEWVKNEIVQKELRTGIRMSLQQYMENSISQRYSEKNAAIDVSNQAWSEAMLGTHQVKNSATGDTYNVPNNYQYWWTDPRGNLVGTVSDTNPDPQAGFVKLEEGTTTTARPAK